MESGKILVIEDEKPIADILKYGFEKEGFLVECAYTGSDGFAMAGRNPRTLYFWTGCCRISAVWTYARC